MNCECNCVDDLEGHKGKVKRVHIINPDPFHDWGEWHYCDNAIAEDRRRGFKVKLLDKEDK